MTSRILTFISCLALLLFFTTTLKCQTIAQNSYAWALAHPHFSNCPHPYVEGSMNLEGPGYAPLAWEIGGGLQLEHPHIVGDAFLGYDNGHKENDGTNENEKGHDRFARAFLAYRHHFTYFGAGARWSQLSTTNYTKGGSIFASGSWHPEVGIGQELGMVARVQALYMFHPSHEVTYYPNSPSCDGCGNGSQGLDLSLTFPSPLHPRVKHFFFRINVVMYRYHTTITEPSNIPLTRTQAGQHFWGDFTEFQTGWRF